MLDAAIVICTGGLIWDRHLSLSGMPLLFSVFFALWTCDLFPVEMQVYQQPCLGKWTAAMFLTDLLQTFIHVATHRMWLGSKIFKAHGVHHTHKRPTPRDAFHTGAIDSFVQVLLPVFVVLHIVRPDRFTAVLYGLCYSQWLLYIHSDWPPSPSKWLVSPEYHRRHHEHPTGHFSHLIAFC